MSKKPKDISMAEFVKEVLTLRGGIPIKYKYLLDKNFDFEKTWNSWTDTQQLNCLNGFPDEKGKRTCKSGPTYGVVIIVGMILLLIGITLVVIL